MKPDNRFRAIYDKEVEWDEAAANEILTLPKGLKMKIFAHDPVMKRIDFKVKFPEGYVEPRHTHKSWHVTLVTKGRVRPAGGRELHPGDLIFGWDEPHGPYQFLDSCEVFAVYMGEGTQHVWDEKEFLRGPTLSKAESSGGEKASERYRVIYDGDFQWDVAAANELLTLPEGMKVKFYFYDPVLKLMVMKVRHPEGYVEPRHTHKSWHVALVTKGRMCVAGKELRAGDYGFGWDEPHGPMEYPDSDEVFIVMLGEGTQHVWNEDEFLRHHTQWKAETPSGEKAAARGEAARKQALGKKKAT